MTTVETLQKRRQAGKGMPRSQEVVRGSIVVMSRHCGKSGCRCQKGFKHRSLYISQRYKGSTRMIYVPKRSEAKARKWIDNYRQLKVILDKISDVNIQILTKGGR
jgi:hypothetical protein